MWTVCWTSAKDGDKWDRVDSRDDVITFTNTLVRKGDVSGDDILIFPPEADNLTVSHGELEE